MDLTISTTPDQDAGLQYVVDAVNAQRPLDTEGNPIGAEVTPEEYALARFQDVLDSYVRQNIEAQAEAVKQAILADPATLSAAQTATNVRVVPVGGGIKVTP